MTDRIGLLIGIVASVSGIILWAILFFFNPYVNVISKEPFLIIFLVFALPAIIGFIASVFKKNFLMYIAFIISFPFSLYAAGTPSIFKFFLAVSLGYLVSALLITIDKIIFNKN